MTKTKFQILTLLVIFAFIAFAGLVRCGPCPDADNDGICDNEDNCPNASNSDQADLDNDGAGAKCDCDDNNPTRAGGVPETIAAGNCDNGLDDDCDGLADNDDPICLAGGVSGDEVRTSIWDLESFGTRYTITSGNAQARAYLMTRLQEYGYSPELDPFEVDGHSTANIIARKAGKTEPDEVVIFSAHYDSNSETPETQAPGADDNASGVAAVLEAARLLASHDFRSTIWFVMTSGEDQGGLGAKHMITWMKAQNIKVRAVLAPDMIAYWPLEDNDFVDILGDRNSETLVNRVASLSTELKLPYKPWINHAYCYGDDHTYFQEAGYPAMTLMDCVEAHNVPTSGETLPYYHKTTDTLETLYLPFTNRVVMLHVAAIADFAQPLPATK
jgi:hypothetical protein